MAPTEKRCDAPDERAFNGDLAKARFRLGQAEGRWRLLNIAWPFVPIVVTAKDGRGYVLRFNCAGYPQTPPTAGPWDVERDVILAFDRWPRSQGGRGLFVQTGRTVLLSICRVIAKASLAMTATGAPRCRQKLAATRSNRSNAGACP